MALITMQDPRAPQQVVRELGRIGMRAVRNDLMEGTTEIVWRLGILGTNALEERREDVSAWVLVYLRDLGDEVTDKSWNKATATILLWLNNIGVESAKQGMSHACSTVITILGNIGLRSLNMDQEELTRDAVHRLMAIGVQSKMTLLTEEGKLTEEVKDIGYELVKLGACALHKKATKLSAEIADAVKEVQSVTLVNIVHYAFWKARKYGSIHKHYIASAEDLDEFAKLFQWPDNEHNEG